MERFGRINITIHYYALSYKKRLIISVILGKRAIPFIWLVRKQKKGHISVKAHLNVLALMSELLPENVKEIVLLGGVEFDSVDLQMFVSV